MINSQVYFSFTTVEHDQRKMSLKYVIILFMFNFISLATVQRKPRKNSIETEN